MAGEMLGADPEQLRALAKEMQVTGSNLRHTSMTLSSVVGRIRWNGPDAENFRRSWSTHRQTMAAVVREMDAASTDLLRNAEEQVQASSIASLGLSMLPMGHTPAPKDHAAAQELTDKLNAMTAAERAEHLRSDEFKKWAAEHPDAAKLAMDQAVAGGLVDGQGKEYRDFLNNHWNNMAMERMGIDPALWDTSKGTEYNWEIIKKVYDFYGQQFLANPNLQWAGMANMIGPSFAGGFKDMDAMREIAQQILNGPLKYIPDTDIQKLRVVAGLTDAEIKFYEMTMLEMNKEIFLDQARQHMAHEQGGIAEIERLEQSGALDKNAANAWRDIDSGDPERVKHGNTVLLNREQNEIINNDYNNMRARPVTGEAVTWMVTLAGEPSIPGAKSYPEVFPYTFDIESPGPKDIPWTNRDNPLQVRTEVTTGLPSGNIADRGQRWELITKDTLPAYQDLLANDPERARDIVASDFGTRVEESRPTNNLVPIVKRIIGGFDVDVHQR